MKFFVKGVELFSNLVRVSLSRGDLDLEKLKQAIGEWKDTKDKGIPMKIEKIQEHVEQNLEGTLHSYLKQVQEMFTRNIASEFADSTLLLTPEEYRVANINVGSTISIDLSVLTP